MPSRAKKEAAKRAAIKRKLKPVIKAKKAQFLEVLKAKDENGDNIPAGAGEKVKRVRRFEKHDRVATDETERRIAEKSLLKAEKVLDSIDVKKLPPQYKAAAYDTLIRNARLLMGQSTSNVAKADLRVIALKVMDAEIKKGKSDAKTVDFTVTAEPADENEYSEDVMKPAFDSE